MGCEEGCETHASHEPVTDVQTYTVCGINEYPWMQF